MQAQLNVWNCESICACGFVDVKQQLDSKDFFPDVLLVDYHLDNENGIEVIAKLYDYLGAEIPAILISADVSQTVKQLAAKMGYKYLSKPVNPAALRKLIARATQNQAVHPLTT